MKTGTFWITLGVLIVGLFGILDNEGHAQPSAQGPMPSGTPMMTMTPMHSHTPMPSMTMTPGPSATPEGGDHTPPQGSLLINDGAETTSDPAVTLMLSAEDNPGGTGVAWMYLREWDWDHQGGWHEMHHGDHQGGHHGGPGHMMDGWQPFASPVEWELAPEPGMRYFTAWFADAAWNVSPPATAMINLVAEDATLNEDQVHQYRYHLQPGQSMNVVTRAHVGDPDLYGWMPGNPHVPDWSSHAPAGDERISFTAPVEGVYLIEVHGYHNAVYSLQMEAAIDAADAVAADEEKSPPAAPLVIDPPDASNAPPPGFRLYLPALLLNP